MDFFASQELARRNSRRLIIYLVLSVICMIIAIYLLALVSLGFVDVYQNQGALQPRLFQPEVLIGVSIGVTAVVGLGSLYRISSLKGGGESVAAMLGGRLVPPNSRDPEERRILNVVEEMALASGTPVPPVYIMDNEPGINAFAAGYTIDDAVIGINRGTIQILSRDELQGVVAHEFSHILNGDMRMSIRIIGLLHGIQMLAMAGYFLLHSMGGHSHRRYHSHNDRNRNAGGLLFLAIGLIAIGWIGMFFARLIKASVSRQREYLADASAVQFTRNPDGIAGALKMIGASMEGSVVQNPAAEETSHMFFASMFKNSFDELFSTHPPLDQRIARIDPHFDGNFTAYAQAQQRKKKRLQPEPKRPTKDAKTRLGIGMPGGSMLPGVLGEKFPIDPLILIAGIGLPGQDDVQYSKVIVDRIPPEIADAARDVFSARSLVYASLIDRDETIRQKQFDFLIQTEKPATLEETQRLLPLFHQLESRFRLPVFEILQGTLTGISPQQYQVFRANLEGLIEADHRVDMFEFFLRHHLVVHLDRKFGLVQPPRTKFRIPFVIKDEICLILALVARIGHTEPPAAEKAFLAAIESLRQPWTNELSKLNQNFDSEKLTETISKLNQASLKIKKQVLTAIAIAITHDKKVTTEEAEMFRAISESLDCPVPPVVSH